MTDNYFQECISRGLVYYPPTHNISEWYTTQGTHLSLARVLPFTSVLIQLVKREGTVVVGTINDQHPQLIILNLWLPLKINSFFSPYYVCNCSNLVTTCSIPNVCSNPSQWISFIINTETTILKTKSLKTINTFSDNLFITFNNHSPLKDRTRSIFMTLEIYLTKSNLFFLLRQ